MIPFLLFFVFVAIVVASFVIAAWLDEPGVTLVSFGLLFIFVFLPATSIARANYNERTVTCTVSEKDRGRDNGSYRIYTEECGVFSNKDQWLRGKTNSADIQGQIKVGQKYDFTVVGWRFPLMSHFPNILEVNSNG